MTPIPTSPDDLLREANETQWKLLRSLGRLNRRGHHAVEASKHIGRYLRPGAASFAVAAACVATIAAYHLAMRGRRRRMSRWRLLQNLWRHPDRELRLQRPFPVEVAHSLLVSLVASALAAPLRRIVEQSGR